MVSRTYKYKKGTISIGLLFVIYVLNLDVWQICGLVKVGYNLVRQLFEYISILLEEVVVPKGPSFVCFCVAQNFSP